MKVYPDANVYVTLLLGEPKAGLAKAFFNKSADCLFELVVSKTTFAEVNMACENRGTMWLQDHLDKFRAAGKLEVVEKTVEDQRDAYALNEGAGREYGLNDFLHALLAKKHSAIFVTQDKKFLKQGSKIVKTMTLGQFLGSLKPEA